MKQSSAMRKFCSHEGCTKQSKTGGVCARHGAKVKRCGHEGGCTNYAQKGGVCVRHGAKAKRCRHQGCSKIAKQGGVCVRHGAIVKVKRCGHAGCNNIIKKGGVCRSHAKSIIAAQGEATPLPQPAKHDKATICGAVSVRSGEIGVLDPQVNFSRAAASRPSPSLPPSVTASELASAIALQNMKMMSEFKACVLDGALPRSPQQGAAGGGGGRLDMMYGPPGTMGGNPNPFARQGGWEGGGGRFLNGFDLHSPYSNSFGMSQGDMMRGGFGSMNYGIGMGYYGFPIMMIMSLPMGGGGGFGGPMMMGEGFVGTMMRGGSDQRQLGGVCYGGAGGYGGSGDMSRRVGP
jgi:hypothetical protein